LFQIIRFSGAYHNPIPEIRASNFNINYISSGRAIAFQSDDTLQIEVLTGLLNGTSGYLLVYNDRGTFRYNATNNAKLEITSPDAQHGYGFSVSGAMNTTQISAFVWRTSVSAGSVVTFSWVWRIESWVDHTMLALGFGGIILMVASPTWVALEIRKKGLDADSIERGAYGMLLFCVGFGLLIMWLWA